MKSKTASQCLDSILRKDRLDQLLLHILAWNQEKQLAIFYAFTCTILLKMGNVFKKYILLEEKTVKWIIGLRKRKAVVSRKGASFVCCTLYFFSTDCFFTLPSTCIGMNEKRNCEMISSISQFLMVSQFPMVPKENGSCCDLLLSETVKILKETVKMLTPYPSKAHDAHSL